MAAADVLGCLAEHRRLAGSGQSGDERLLAAMRARDEKVRAQLAVTTAALRENMVRVVDDTRAVLRPTIEAMLRQPRPFERLVQPPVIEQMLS